MQQLKKESHTTTIEILRKYEKSYFDCSSTLVFCQVPDVVGVDNLDTRKI